MVENSVRILNGAIENFDLSTETSSGDEQDVQVQSSYNIEHSQDVVIGPVTHYHCPVTIIQKNSSSENDKAIEHPPKQQICRKKLLWIITPLTILTLIAVLLSIVFIASNPESKNISEGNQNVSQIGTLIPRSIWGARPPLYPLDPIKIPTKYVIIAHTAGEICDTLDACSSYLQSLQSHTVSQGSPDIGYNFLIGSDNNVYEGRGWTHRNYLQNNSLAISFIGNFAYDKFTEGMQETLKEFLEYGVQESYLSEDYVLLSHSQTFATLSPGRNVRDVISKWPHYYQKAFIEIP